MTLIKVGHFSLEYIGLILLELKIHSFPIRTSNSPLKQFIYVSKNSSGMLLETVDFGASQKEADSESESHVLLSLVIGENESPRDLARFTLHPLSR
ncbi:hypothetical protein CEXT_395091 [Caerostris extrusa]|uniref:Uncharacterized protein n=1 Tax=Caerostris extrusa TaxID=172846 RepID=A0AAV4P4J7_CAEEX|nr:hypothetical protein CEXT_395091 [Caerostris extrusa]